MLYAADPIGLAGGLNLYGFANGDPGGLNLYGFADGDPVNFSDPFGLCPDSLKTNGRCPGDLSDDEWGAVERSTGHMTPKVSERIITMLHDGKIRGAEFSERKGGSAPWVVDHGTIKLNRASQFGSVFAYRPQDVAYYLKHELRHVDHASGQPGISRFLMNLIRIGFPGLGDAIEQDAVRFGCANLTTSSPYMVNICQ